jgi:hypothetical protein
MNHWLDHPISAPALKPHQKRGPHKEPLAVNLLYIMTIQNYKAFKTSLWLYGHLMQLHDAVRMPPEALHLTADSV